MMKKRRVTVIALLLIAGIVGYLLYPKGSRNVPSFAGNQRNRVLPVRIYVVEPHGLTDTYPANSRLNPSEDVNLSFEASGRITEILFKEGSYVKEGQLLAKMNDARLQAQLKKLQAQMSLYKSKEFRQKSLLERDAISQQAYDESKTNVELTEADIELVKAQIRETELRAPFDGLIGLRNVSEGAFATPSTVIAKLTKVSPLKLEVSLPEKFVTMVRPGTELTFHIDDDTTRYKSGVYAVESESSEIHTFTVRAYYPNLKREISPGRYASILLKLDYQADGLSVPAESVIAEMGRQVVYTMRGDKARRVEIQTGLRTESFVQVLGGLSAGDTVITTGIMQLRDGITVTINNSND